MKYTYRDTLYACYIGYMVQAINNNLAPILFIIFQDAFVISYEMLGRLILINFGTQILADIIALNIADRVGYRRMAIVAHLFSVVGLVALGVLPHLLPSPYLGLVIAVMIYAVGGGIIEVIISPIVESLPGDAKASAMSLLHSFYCWGQLLVVVVTTILLQVLGSGIWWLLPIVWALVPLYNLYRFTRVPLLPTVSLGEKTPVKQLFTARIFIIALVLMLCAGASELTMSQWSSLFAERALQLPKIVGDLLGPSLFAVFMGLGRTLYGVWGERVNIRVAMLATGVMCVACYAVTIFAPNPALSLLGLALCGFSVSLMWPGTFSLTAAGFPRGGVAMFGILAVFGDIGAAVGPWLAGFVSDVAQRSNQLLAWGATFSLNPEQLGLRMGLFVAMFFPLLLVIGVLLMRQHTTESSVQPDPVPAD